VKLRHVSSAQLQCVISSATCYLNYGVSAQVHNVSSAQLFCVSSAQLQFCKLSCSVWLRCSQLSCNLAARLAAQLHPVSSDVIWHQLQPVISPHFSSVSSYFICPLHCVLSDWLRFVSSATTCPGPHSSQLHKSAICCNLKKQLGEVCPWDLDLDCWTAPALFEN